MHLNSWPEAEVAGLSSILKRLYALCPTPDTQTHLLHLASYGEILPHVDNVSASGSWIMGVSLGGERMLRMEGPNGDNDMFEVLLPSGSVYLQRDSMRFQYKHSILKGQLADGSDARAAQRLSIMIRDLPRSSSNGDT
ncbi:putative 2OG-Fe(II) oxygenase superfamily protein [Lyophyllum shimeji]|uniref:2OG-Fe(II) oxygenase superfamily protein n=1 Tax=Lyophyllum shimeji TaxID=47721 RepID=A0A9P3PGJ6_LYOSH|nr:putative 2OG-Fe(II) oxygenase superfamily protein [Lyophyllum shimeji]